MNMKKTMAAIAAGAVAVSAMATTVSAATLETKTLTYNLVKTVKESSDAEVKLTAKFYNVPLTDGDTATFTIKNLNNDDIVRVSGVYIEEGKQIVPIVATKDQGQSGIYSFKTDAMLSTGASGTLVVPVKASNTTEGVALMGGTTGSEATVKTPATNAALGGTATIAADAKQDQDKLNTAATAALSYTYHTTCTTGETAPGWLPTATAVSATTAPMTPAEFTAMGIDITKVTATDTQTLTVSQYTAAVMNDDAVAGAPVSANITVEVTKKKIGGLVGVANTATTTTRNLADKDNGLKNVNAELQANGVLGIGLNVGGFTVAPANADVTASDYTRSDKIRQYPYKSSLNNYLYKATGLTWDDNGGDAEGGDVLNHIYTVKTDDNSDKINPISVQAVINDAIAKHGEVTFTFNTAAHPVKVRDVQYDWYHTGEFGTYADDWAGAGEGCVDYTSFANHYYNANQAGYDPNTTYILNNWLGDNLFNGALLVNSNLTLALNDTQKFDWTATSLSFTWEAIQDSALTTNQYANYIQNMVLRTSADWYWDNFQVILGETEVEEVESGAPVEGDVEDLPEDEEETDLGASDEEEEEEEEEEESEPAPEVAPAVESNPGTGNAPVALAVIPVALAAAAIVAKKRG